MSKRDDVIRKINAALALAKGAGTPEEAATATAIAQKLKERHDICEVDLGVVDEEEIGECLFGIPLRRKSGWQGNLADAVAKAFGCSAIWRTGPSHARIVIAGRRSDVEMAVKVRSHCHAEIDRLTAKNAAGMGRGWGVSFRHGCVQALKQSFEAEREALRREMRGHVSETALAIVDTRSRDAEESFGKLKKAPPTRLSNEGAYVAGIVVGRHIHTGTKPRVEA